MSPTSLRALLLLLAMAAGAPASAFAEVSDKVPAISEHWLTAVPVALVVFVAAGVRWWLGALASVVPAFMLFGTLDLSFDPHVGAALWHEQGWSYFASLWGADLLVVGALALGLRRGWMRRHPRRDIAVTPGSRTAG